MAYIGTAALKELWGRIKNYFSLKSETVKNITRNGTTFTATRANGTTFTFDQKDTTYSTMTGATASTNGKAGLVPAPSAGNQDYYLKADGTWTSIAEEAQFKVQSYTDIDGNTVTALFQRIG